MFEYVQKPGNNFVLYMCSVIIPSREGQYEYYMNVVMKLPSRRVFPFLKNIIFFNILLQFPFLNSLFSLLTKTSLAVFLCHLYLPQWKNLVKRLGNIAIVLKFVKAVCIELSW